MTPSDLFRNRVFVHLVSVSAVLGVWGFFEWKGSVRINSIRLGFFVALLSYPGLVAIYDYGLAGDDARGFEAMGLSFFYKFVILFGSVVVLRAFVNISFQHYIFSLFFTIFCLGFVAIYLARIESEYSLNSD